MASPLRTYAERAINEAGQNGRQPGLTLDDNQTIGGPVMPENTGKIPCGDSASKSNSDNWQSVGDVAQRIREKLDRALTEGHFEAAESYHQRLVTLEAGE